MPALDCKTFSRHWEKGPPQCQPWTVNPLKDYDPVTYSKKKGFTDHKFYLFFPATLDLSTTRPPDQDSVGQRHGSSLHQPSMGPKKSKRSRSHSTLGFLQRNTMSQLCANCLAHVWGVVLLTSIGVPGERKNVWLPNACVKKLLHHKAQRDSIVNRP